MNKPVLDTTHYPIPDIIRVLRKCEAPSNHERLIEIFLDGGISVEPDNLLIDGGLVKSVMYVTSTGPSTTGGKGKYGFKQSSGNWLYCGDRFYVRFIGGAYEFARFMAHNTRSRQDTGLWVDKP